MSRGESRGTYGASKGFTRVSDDLVDSPAFLALPDSAQRVLFDYLSYFGRATHFDKVDPPEVTILLETGQVVKTRGIEYSYGHCRIPISRAQFYRACKFLRTFGFVKRVKVANGAPFLWWPSGKWRDCPEHGIDDATAARIASVRARRKIHEQETRTRQLRLELFAGPGIMTGVMHRATAPSIEPHDQAKETRRIVAEIATMKAVK